MESKTQLNIDEITALVFQHSRRAMQARKTANELLILADEDDKIAQVYKEVGKRFNREVEAKESKVTIRKIIGGLPLVFVLLVCMFSLGSQRRTLAQDVPEVTATIAATVNGTQVAATLEPIESPQQNTPATGFWSALFDKAIDIALTIAVIVLAFKTAGLIPQDTVDKILARAFDLARGLADNTTTPIDNRILEIAQPIVTKMIDDELAKRNSVSLTQPAIQVPPGSTVVVPQIQQTDFTAR